jgi:hypothetical protein
MAMGLHPNVILFRNSQVESPKIIEIVTPTILEAHNLLCKSLIDKSCSLCQDISKDMWHTTFMQVNQGNSRLLVVESQIDTLTPSPSFGHNLCFKYSNGKSKPILNI